MSKPDPVPIAKDSQENSYDGSLRSYIVKLDINKYSKQNESSESATPSKLPLNLRIIK